MVRTPTLDRTREGCRHWTTRRGEKRKASPSFICSCVDCPAECDGYHGEL